QQKTIISNFTKNNRNVIKKSSKHVINF
ncbi:peptide methionine sulfoxide reductase MsrA, partial [Enterococcus faecium]